MEELQLVAISGLSETGTKKTIYALCAGERYKLRAARQNGIISVQSAKVISDLDVPEGDQVHGPYSSAQPDGTPKPVPTQHDATQRIASSLLLRRPVLVLASGIFFGLMAFAVFWMVVTWILQALTGGQVGIRLG